MSCDTSPCGVAAVQNYSHLEKEVLDVVFGVKKIHEYCFRRLFIIDIDHKPLLGIIEEHKDILTASSAQIQRWLLFLSNHQYELTYHPGNSSSNADAVSCLPLPLNGKEEQVINFYGINLLQLDNSPISSKEVERESRRGNIIVCVIESVLTGNWEMCREHERFKNFVCRQNEFVLRRIACYGVQG